MPSHAGGAPPPSGSRRARHHVWTGGIVGLVGLLLTLVVSWTALVLNEHTDHRLLVVQTRQAAQLLTSAIQGLSAPLTTAAQIAVASDGNAADFQRYVGSSLLSGGQFADATLFRVRGGAASPVVSSGVPAALAADSARAQAFVSLATRSPTFVVTSIQEGGQERVGYAVAVPHEPGFVVYAERIIPADREVPIESTSAFAELNYATYLGASANAATLATTDLPDSRLPLTGDTVRYTLPFGDSHLILITSARGNLGGAFAAALPWIFLVGGLLLSLGVAVAAAQLVARRERAESDAATITGLYQQLDGLYGQQRTIAETLQLALLPRTTPSSPSLQVATRYVAGAAGVDIGGDWYSIDMVDARTLAFVVGDVSGRGVQAAAIMARLRFTLRAYLLEGHAPDQALTMCSAQLDIAADGHLSTVLVGVVDLATGALRLASAGHPSPLVVADGTARFLTVEVGPPLGLGWPTYEASTAELPAGATLIGFTDGLVERRDESIDAGLHRLAQAAAGPYAALEAQLDGIVAALASEGPEDDIAILAFRVGAAG